MKPRPVPQSAIEEECLWSIVQASVAWALLSQRRPLNALAYWRALGLD